MQKISSVSQLRQTILLLEIKQVDEKQLLKEQFKITYERLSSINLIKSTLHKLVAVPELKGNLVNTTLSLAAGYLSKKVVVGATHKPFKQLLGTLLQIGVSNIVSKNPEAIKLLGHNIINLFNKKK